MLQHTFSLRGGLELPAPQPVEAALLGADPEGPLGAPGLHGLGQGAHQGIAELGVAFVGAPPALAVQDPDAVGRAHPEAVGALEDAEQPLLAQVSRDVAPGTVLEAGQALAVGGGVHHRMPRGVPARAFQDGVDVVGRQAGSGVVDDPPAFLILEDALEPGADPHAAVGHPAHGVGVHHERVAAGRGLQGGPPLAVEPRHAGQGAGPEPPAPVGGQGVDRHLGKSVGFLEGPHVGMPWRSHLRLGQGRTGAPRAQRQRQEPDDKTTREEAGGGHGLQDGGDCELCQHFNPPPSPGELNSSFRPPQGARRNCSAGPPPAPGSPGGGAGRRAARSRCARTACRPPRWAPAPGPGAARPNR